MKAVFVSGTNAMSLIASKGSLNLLTSTYAFFWKMPS